jgi:hypothetical protein
MRSVEDQSAPLGIATTRFEERAASALGAAGPAAPRFEHHNGVLNGGVLLLLPALMVQGLFTVNQTHQLKQGYYGLEQVALTLALMALCRIKNPEQLKQCKPGELGRLIGLDRVPELRCLRSKIKELTSLRQAEQWGRQLLSQWLPADQEHLFLYVDGHVRIYSGYAAQLTSKYVSRQKLCLSATTEFWINDVQGQPLLVCTGELSEKLQHIIEQQMIPQLFSSKAIVMPAVITENTPAVCTLVFDREAYEPAFFARLWASYRIAVITYRKHVKDQWDADLFDNHEVVSGCSKKTMQLCEMGAHLGGHWFRELRCLTGSGHQTSVITTHPLLSQQHIAGAMFNRWSQENFFKYMLSDYSFDHIAEYGIEMIDGQKMVVNPAYRKLNHQIKKEKEKLQRLQAALHNHITRTGEQPLEQMGRRMDRQGALTEQLQAKHETIDALVLRRKEIPPRITLAQMPQPERYNKLKTESLLLLNIIKMICFRAETATAGLLYEFFKRAEDERRMLVKQIIFTPADIIPDYANNTLTIALHTLSAPRFNEAVQQLIRPLNETQTIFPGTNLTMIFKTHQCLTATDQEF